AKGSNETQSINGDCNTATKPLKINQHDEPISPLNHKAICSKYLDDGHLSIIANITQISHGLH
ncbi:MAG: hypothetical protein ABJL33_07165, partial [Hyphomicrobiales bacterium]